MQPCLCQAGYTRDTRR